MHAALHSRNGGDDVSHGRRHHKSTPPTISAGTISVRSYASVPHQIKSPRVDPRAVIAMLIHTSGTTTSVTNHCWTTSRECSRYCDTGPGAVGRARLRYQPRKHHGSRRDARIGGIVRAKMLEVMLARAFLIWCVLLALAILNGALREAVMSPRAGDVAGHAISTGTLCVLILLVSWVAISWIRPLSARDVWTIGGLWLGLTVVFEFVAGHYLFGNPWSRLFQDYNVFRGRIWALVLMMTAVAPWLAARMRGLLT